MLNLISDPFATFKFRVEIDGIQNAAFTECTGLDMSLDVLEQPEGGLNEYTHKFPGRTKWSNVTLKRGLAVTDDLYNWYMTNLKSFNAGEGVKLKNVTIILHAVNTSGGEGLVKLKMFHLNKAFPVKWTGPNFKTDETAYAVESLELAHHGITMSKT